MKLIRNLLAAAVTFALAGGAHAIPSLQLDILNGTYVGGSDETVYPTAGANSFKLYAYLTPKEKATAAEINALLADTYYLSMAVVPKTGPTGASLDSFTIEGSTINVTGDMVYGTPPLETIATQLHDSGDLSDHGIFETFFAQRSFQFSNGAQSAPYNTQTTVTHTGPQTGTGMYYVAFDIDVTNLDSNTAIHFDLYNTAVLACAKNGNNCLAGDIDVNDFAPYSHDAQSTKGGGGREEEVPEPGSLLLLGGGILGLWATRRRMAR